MRSDKSHIEHVERWAEFVKSHPINEWKPQVSELVNSQIKMSERFYENLSKAENGKEKIRKLRFL
jgi:hypothetical protein